MTKNKLVRNRITKMLNEKQMTTGQIKDRLYNAKTSKGLPSKRGMPTTNQLQMILRIHYSKAGFCNKAKQTIWKNKENEFFS